MQKVIILNGCPGIGKDTIGCVIADMNQLKGVRTLSFKAPMFEIARAILGDANYDYFLFLYNDRLHKEKPDSVLNGKSPREFMIWISEAIIKPEFGNDYFGRRMVEAIKASDTPAVITDGGFTEETIALIESGIQVHVCRLHRGGFTFEGDSRSYLHLPVGWHGVNGYTEEDFTLRDGDPDYTASVITGRYLK
ncbi:putative P-loop NTPase protein [Escherichia phage BrunoManser]|uniref:P-loop NTPase protein n=1 Tax=Escherichia phage BrunoManser TaxID=2851976 RepID=A0AAE8AY51_9CAUD|nr:putative P-loop NTPase protein [Escherichia phage BrunoManser]